MPEPIHEFVFWAVVAVVLAAWTVTAVLVRRSYLRERVVVERERCITT